MGEIKRIFIIYNLIYLVTLGIIIYFALKLKSEIPKDEVSQEPLNKVERIIVWLLCLFHPILGGAYFWILWKKQLPVMAKSAKQISSTALFINIIILLYLIAFILENVEFPDFGFGPWF